MNDQMQKLKRRIEKNREKSVQKREIKIERLNNKRDFNNRINREKEYKKTKKHTRAK